MIYEDKLLSKIINDSDLSELYKGNITLNDFPTRKETYKFILDYNRKYGEVPPAEVVAVECDFEYFAEVPDNYRFLVKAIKDDTGKRTAYTLLDTEMNKKFAELSGSDFADWLLEQAKQIKEVTMADTGTGTNFATSGKERARLYLERKDSRTGRFVPTPYRSLNEWLGGGGELGDYMLINAYTNRGKSWLASDFGICAWNNGFGVMHYSPELSKEQQLDRLDTIKGHFDNLQLKMGTLSNESSYMQYLEQFGLENECPYIVKTMDDMETGLSLEAIESDLQSNPDIKVVIIDGFNLMAHKKSGNSNREAMSNTSRAMRQLFGKYKVLGIVVHQTPTSAERENKQNDESGLRIVKPPEIHQYSETIAVVQDACTVLTFDAFQGIGKIKLAKARTPFVGNEIEVQCDFNMGYIREVTPVDFF